MKNKLLLDLLKEFYPYAKKRLGFDRNAKIILKGDKDNAKDPLGKTAFYDPSADTVYVYTTGRHPKDIVRSTSHELVHHAQNCRGHLNQQGHETDEGYAQKDPHLRNMEKEAYEQGNIIFRDWEDERKQRNQVMNENKKQEEEINPLKKEKANDHYAKRADKVYKELIERWGFNKQNTEKQEENKK